MRTRSVHLYVVTFSARLLACGYSLGVAAMISSTSQEVIHAGVSDKVSAKNNSEVHEGKAKSSTDSKTLFSSIIGYSLPGSKTELLFTPSPIHPKMTAAGGLRR